MAAEYTGQRFYPVPIDYFIQKSRMVGQAGIKMRYASEVPIPNGVFIRMNKNMSWASWGEDIQVTLLWAPNGTQVNIHSECTMPTQIIDFNSNKKNVDTLYSYFDSGLNAPV